MRKAEGTKSRRDGRSLQMFQIESKDPAETEAIIYDNITCPQTGIVFKVEKCRDPISVRQCYNCQNFGHSTKNCQAKTKCVVCGEGHSRRDSRKGCPTRGKMQPNCATVKDHMLLTIKGVQLIKNRCSVNMWWRIKKINSFILKQNSAPP